MSDSGADSTAHNRHPRAPLDPGLQGERTGLAWTRTSISLAAICVLVLRAGIVEDKPVLTVLGIALGGFTVAVALFGWRRHDVIDKQLRDGKLHYQRRLMALPAAATAVAGVAVLLAVLLPTGG